MKKINFFLIILLLILGCNKMGFAGIHTWNRLTENNGKVVPFQMDQLKEVHVDPDFLAELLNDIKAKVSAADLNSGFINDKIAVIGLNKRILYPGADEQLELENEQKIKVRSDDGLAGFMDDKLLVDYTLDKQIIDATTNLKVQLGICDFAGLSALDMQCLDVGIVQDKSGVKRKVTPEMLSALSSRAWIREGLSNSEYTPVSDATATVIDMVSLDPANGDYLKNKILSWGLGDLKARCLGLATHAGAVGVGGFTEEDLVKLHGSVLELVAEDYSTSSLSEQCWFSLKIGEVNNADSFGFDYQMPASEPIDFVISATFVFNYPPGTNDPSLAKWMLLGFETLPRKLWKESTFDYNYIAPTHFINIPADPDKFPFDGYYYFNVDIAINSVFDFSMPPPPPPYSWTVFWNSINVWLDDADGSRQVLLTPSTTLTVARAGVCFEDCYSTLSGVHNDYMLNICGHFRINAANCDNRKLRLRILDPTGFTTFGIVSVDWSVEYVIKKKAHYCNDFLTPPP